MTQHIPDDFPITMRSTAAFINSHHRDKAWAVYQVVDASGDIVFIGSCKADRVFSLPDARRNTEFIKRFEVPGEYYGITVIEYTAERIVAAKNAMRYIAAIKPHCNTHGIVASLGKQIECIETGERWPSMMACVRALNLSQPQMSAHINRKSGYATVHGRTYRQVIDD